MDSNHDKRSQSALCYRYTKEQNKLVAPVGHDPTSPA